MDWPAIDTGECERAITIAVYRVQRQWPELPTVIDRDDLIQQCWCLLPELIERYQEQPGVSYHYYLVTQLQWCLRRYIRSFGHQRSKRIAMYSADHDKLLRWQEIHQPELPEWESDIETSESLQSVERLLLRVLGLHAICGLSFSEISRQLGLPRATVYDLYRRALDGARQALAAPAVNLRRASAR